MVGPATATDNALARFDTATGKLIKSSVLRASDAGELTLPGVSSPVVPAANTLSVMARRMGGRMMLGMIGPSGVDTSLQPFFGSNGISMWLAAGNARADTLIATSVATTGTSTGANVSATNLHTRTKRRDLLVTVAATTAVVGVRVQDQQWSIGGIAAGDGGFTFAMRWGPATGVANASHRAFAGMMQNTAPTDVNPSTLTLMVGMGYDAADANIQFMHNDGAGTATKINLGASFPKPAADRTKVYDIRMFAPPGTTQVLTYEVIDLSTGAIASGTVTTDLPPTSQLLCPQVFMSVGGVSSVIGVALNKIYVETDI